MRSLRVIALIGALTALSACNGPKDSKIAKTATAALSLSSAPMSLSCSGCHHPSNQAIPDISRLSSEALYAALAGYKSAPDGETVMHRLMTGYSDEDLRAIADDFGAADE